MRQFFEDPLLRTVVLIISTVLAVGVAWGTMRVGINENRADIAAISLRNDYAHEKFIGREEFEAYMKVFQAQLDAIQRNQDRILNKLDE